MVEAAGPAVTEFTVGDDVFGVKAWTFGAHAEYVCMRQSAALAHKPADVGFEEAAAVCDGVILALMGLRPAEVGKGRSILVYGASGSIGTAAVQLSRHFEADVTAVCGTKNLELVRSLGADQVIDYTREDFTANGQTYDVIFDAVGKHSFRRCRGSLNPGGIYLATDDLRNLLLAQWTRFGDKKVIFPIPPRYTKRDVLFLKGLMEAGQYRAVIDKRYPLAEVVEANQVRRHRAEDRERGPDRRLRHGRHVPGQDDRLAVLVAEGAERPGVQPEQSPGSRLEPQVAGGEHAQYVAVRDQRDVAVGQQRLDPAQHPVHPLAHLLHRLPGVRGVTRDHAVPPQVPARAPFLDLPRGQALIAAVVPLPQVGVRLGVGQPRQVGRPDRALRRTGEDGHDVPLDQQRSQRRGGGMADRGERDVRPSRVLALLAPLGLAVPQQDQVSHGP